MSKTKKRILAAVITLAILIAGAVAIQVFAEEPIAMPTRQELGYGRGMYAVYEMWQKGEIDQETFETYLPEDAAKYMYYGQVSDSTSSNYSFTMPEGNQGMEGMTFERRIYGRTKMWWYFSPQAGETTQVFQDNSNEASQNFYFLFGTNITHYTSSTDVSGFNPCISIWDPDRVGYYYQLIKKWNTHYGPGFAWGVEVSDEITMSDFSAYLLDHSQPGSTEWWAEIKETGDLSGTTYQLKLSPKNGDKLRVVNENITVSELSERLQLNVTVCSTNGSTYQIPAKAVNVDTTGIYFDFYGDLWASLWQENLTITSIQANTTYSSYEIYDPYKELNVTDLVGLTADLPVTDLAGNVIVLNEYSHIWGSSLVIDRNSPVITGMDFRPSTASYGATEIDYADSFLGGKVYSSWNENVPVYYFYKIYSPTVQFNENVFVEEENFGKVQAVLNVYDKDGNLVTTPLTGTRGNQLCFASVNILPGMYTVAGDNVKIIDMIGFEHVRDRVGNYSVQNMAELRDKKTFVAPYKIYVDGYSPEATIGTAVIQWRDATGAYYTEYDKIQNQVEAVALTIPIEVVDKTAITINGQKIDISAVGCATTTAYAALYNTYSDQPLDYRFTITQSQDFPDPNSDQYTWASGTVSGSDKSRYVAFGLGNETQKSYLHLELTDLDGYEFSDVTGLSLSLSVSDQSGNQTSVTQSFNGIHVDNKAPRVSVTKYRTAPPQNGTATLSASASATDLNGIESVWYAWSEVQTDNPTYLQTEMYADLTYQVSGTAEKTVYLYIKAVDVYGNYTVREESFTVNLATAINQYEIHDDLTLPTIDPGITVSAPLTSDNEALNVAEGTAVTRVSFVIHKLDDTGAWGTDIYYRYYDATAENEDPFTYGEGIGWYYQYSEYTNPDLQNLDGTLVEGTPGWAAHYGDIEVYIASSIEGFTEGNYMTGGSSYSQEKIGTVAFAPNVENLYTVSYLTNYSSNPVYNVWGELVEVVASDRTEDGDLARCYYRVDHDMAGLQVTMTLANNNQPNWGAAGIDLAGSYAVLVGINPDGSIKTNSDGTYAEMSARLPLENTLTQTLTVPATAKDGNAFATGAYSWVLYIAQKGGAVQCIDDCFFLLLLDSAEAATDNFGIREHMRSVEVTWGGTTIDHIVKNDDGSILGSINIGIAEVSELNYNGINEVTKHYIDGYYAYSTGVMNGLTDQRGINPTASFTLTASTDSALTYGDITIGAIKGIRFWNKGSLGEGEASYITADQSYSNNGVTGVFAFDKATGIATLTVEFLCGTQEAQQTNIVTAEELSAKNPGVFAVTTGSNTICYQLIMENGNESPVYEFQLNLVEEAPQVTVDFRYGPSYESPFIAVDGNWNYSSMDLMTAEYIDVFFTDVISSYSDLSVYYVSYDYVEKEGYQVGDRDDAYSVHRLTAEELANGFRITSGSRNTTNETYYYAGEGFRGTRTAYSWPGYSNYGTDAFFVVFDASGNALALYPIDERDCGHDMEQIYLDTQVKNREDGTGSIFLPYGSTSLGMVAQKVEVLMDRVYDSNGNVLADGYTLAELACSYDYEIETLEDGSLSVVHKGTVDTDFGSGAVGYKTAESGNRYLHFAWPYDATKAEGELVTHTVEIVYYIGDHIKKETFTLEVPNTKPTATAQTLIGGVALTYNVPVNTVTGGIGTTDYLTLTSPDQYGTTYNLVFADLYGNSYSQVITIDEMPGLTISYSTTEPTTEPVIVTVSYTSELYLEGSTTGQTALELTFTENGTQALYDADGNLLGRIVVTNIYDTLEVDPYIFWDYRATDIQDGNTVYGEVTAYVVDRNGAIILDPATGEQAFFTFYPGGQTQYTFSGCYSDRGASVADITATLTVQLAEKPVDTDEHAPDVDILSYVTFESKAYNAETVYRIDSGRFAPESLKDYAALYGTDCYYDDMTEMVAALGWAESYMFHFSVRDESKVKLILRADLYEENITYNTASQNIDGVTLVGRTLEIKENGEFALYMVDEYNNCTPIYFLVTTLGAEPVPNTQQVLATDENGKNVVRVYLMPLQLTNVTDLKITNEGALVDNNDYSTTDEGMADLAEIYSSYQGLYYIVCNENGTYPIHYSYVYRGLEHTGTTQVTVDMIDNTVASVTSGSWSHNYYEAPTNQDITWQAQLNVPVRSVSAVYLKDGEYMAIANTTLQEHGVYISYMDDQITVIFENSTAALEEAYGPIYLKLTARRNDMVSYHRLPSVTAIDKTAPTLNAVVSYSADHKEATVTVTADETVISQNANRKGTEFTFTIRENTTKTYAFVDAAGNRSSIQVTVDGLVFEPLTITLMDAEGNIIQNPARYEAQIGEKLKVLTNRPATVWVYGEELNAQECDGSTPVELVVSANNMGLHPTFGAEDAYGNTAAVQLEYIMPRNLTAPVLVVHRLKVSVSCNATEEEIMEKLLANILYSDDNTAHGDLEVYVDYDKNSTASRRVVTYTVIDDAGNLSTAQCWLQIRSGLEPEITVSGTEVQPDDILYLGNVSEVTVTVTFDGGLGEPYKLVYEAGNLQSWAKLKDGIYLTNGYTDDATATFTLTSLADGWYSFALITQSMEVYYFQIHIGVVS